MSLPLDLAGGKGAPEAHMRVIAQKIIVVASLLLHVAAYHTTNSDAIVYMFLVSILRYALLLLAPLSIASTTYLYLYPVFNFCAFPSAHPESNSGSPFLNTLREHTSSTAYNVALKAPFRLLALGDPQLEGDTSIPDPDVASFPHLQKFWRDAFLLNGTKHSLLERIRYSLHDLVDFYFDDIPKTLESYRKRLDLLGNDYYLAHIYRTLYWWTKPTHVTVLGDLVGSQWIEDDEFDVRGWRYWNRVFKHGNRVSDELTAEHPNWDDVPLLSDDAEAWSRRIINVAGNHDIGYAGDLTPERFSRFERVFGRANYELRFHLPTTSPSSNNTSLESTAPDIPELRLIILNDMNLDTPASSPELQDATYTFINNLITASHPVTRSGLFTLLLTHIPLHKAPGICVDAPFFDFHDSEEFAFGVKEQNHLSAAASKGILEGIFGKSGNENADGWGYGRKGLVMTGHDHEGCDVYHFINQSLPGPLEPQWEARRWADAGRDGIVEKEGLPGLREITVRSMMGEFGGNAGLLSLWFDEAAWEWKFEFETCPLGVQHWWWAVHVLNLVTLIVGFVWVVLVALQRLAGVSVELGNPWADKGKTRSLKKLGGRDDTKTNGPPTTPGSGLEKRSLRKKRSKRGLNGSAEPESGTYIGHKRQLSSVFESQVIDGKVERRGS